MLEKFIAILSKVVVSNTAITIYKEKRLPSDTRNCSVSVKRKQRQKKSTMVSCKLFFLLLIKRTVILSDTTMDKHKGQALAQLYKSQYTTELITYGLSCIVKIFHTCNSK